MNGESWVILRTLTTANYLLHVGMRMKNEINITLSTIESLIQLIKTKCV